MEALIINITNYFNENGDDRVKDWFLMSSPWPTMVTCLIYSFSVTKFLPKLMDRRKTAFELKQILLIYNLIQVIASCWLFYGLMANGWWRNYSLKCQLVDHATFGKPMRMANAAYWYFIVKFTEFVDTIFFIMRKKNNQVSFLHVFHHGIMPICSWLCVRMSPGGTYTMFMVINSFVHILMYAYYLASAYGIRFHYKNLLTTIQITQFILLMSHSIYLCLISGCKVNKSLYIFGGSVVIVFLFKFIEFYVESYVKSGKKKAI